MYQRLGIRLQIVSFIATLFGVFVLGQGVGSSQPINFEKLWQNEQRERNEARKQITKLNASPEDISLGIKRMEALLEQVSQVSESDFATDGFARILYFQRNDLITDLIGIYASQRNTKMVEHYATQLKDSLTSKRSPCSGGPSGDRLYAWYAERIMGHADVRSMLPNQIVEDVANEFRSHDRFWYFRSYPYATSDSTDISVEDRIAGLSQLWADGKYSFANFDLVPELDWHLHYSQFLPLVIAANDRYEYYRVLRRFMSRLRDSHTDVNLPLSLRQTMEVFPALQTEWIDNRVYVSKILSPELSKLGLAVGDEVLTINGSPVHEYAEAKWGDQVSCSTPQDRLVRIYTYYLLRGPLDETIELQVQKADSSKKTIGISRTVQPTVGSKPFQFRKLEKDIAHVTISTFGDEGPVNSFVENWGTISRCKAMVLDLRDNDGGNSEYGDRLLSMLIEKPVVPTRWSTVEVRAAHRAWDQSPKEWTEDSTTIKPIEKPFRGPVCVLTSSKTFSAGEDFVAAFLVAKRGPVIGQVTGGSTGQPISCLLPGGGSARFCAKRDRFADGREFVGKGIEPTILVPDSVARLRNDTDPVLSQAIEEMNHMVSSTSK
jgi:carboxyl-terminal processing protease